MRKLSDDKLMEILKKSYTIQVDKILLFRDSGSVTYTVLSGSEKYFLRVTKPAFQETVAKSVEVHLYLQSERFAVPRIIFTKDDQPYVQINEDEEMYLVILYEFLEGEAVNQETDAGQIGELLGRFHMIMSGYKGKLMKRDRYFMVDRYLDIMRRKRYRKVDEFARYGNELWDTVKDLPQGFCHGDMYSGNIHKTPEGKLYILDFDTSCYSFPMYDLVLIGNMTDYFELQADALQKSKEIYARLLTGYLKYRKLTQEEIRAFYRLIALYHFALQATIIEVFGLDCVDSDFFDRQLEWLYRWREQCQESNVW